MRATLAALLMALALLATSTADERCEEDMSCWDCTTMGNGLCG